MLLYDADGIRLYQGDCREQTDWLDADLLVTDPPYGVRWRQGTLHGDAHSGIIGDSSTAVRDAALTLWGNRPAVVFGSLKLPPPVGTKQTLIYRKPPGSGCRGTTAGFRRDLEAVHLVGPWPSGLGGRTSLLETGWRVMGSRHGLAARSGHPHAKPCDVLELLISLRPGVVADPFCGSGSTLVAAQALGRSAVGVEITAGYAQCAAERLCEMIPASAS